MDIFRRVKQKPQGKMLLWVQGRGFRELEKVGVLRDERILSTFSMKKVVNSVASVSGQDEVSDFVKEMIMY